MKLLAPPQLLKATYDSPRMNLTILIMMSTLIALTILTAQTSSRASTLLALLINLRDHAHFLAILEQVVCIIKAG